MAIANTTVSVSASATLLKNISGVASFDPIPITIYVESATTVYIGGSTVTTATGIPVAQSASKDFVLSGSDPLYGITTTGTSTVRIMSGRQ